MGKAGEPAFIFFKVAVYAYRTPLLFLLPFLAMATMAAPSTPAAAIAAQTDPARLATFKGDRAANPRLQRCIYWLATAKAAGEKPEAVLDEAAKLNNTAGTSYAGFVRWGLLNNLKNAKELGLLTLAGMAELRRGKSATITKGEYTGQEADHTIPRSVCPEIENQVFNLELTPASLNRAKGAKITDRARVFARELYDAGLLSEEGLRAVEACTRRSSLRGIIKKGEIVDSKNRAYVSGRGYIGRQWHSDPCDYFPQLSGA